jgi:hypothetical protein
LLPLRGRLLCAGGDLAFAGAGDAAVKRMTAAGAAGATAASACAASCAAAEVSARPHIVRALGLRCSAATSSEGLGNDTA